MSVIKATNVKGGCSGTNEVPPHYKQPRGHVLMMGRNTAIYTEEGNREKIRSTQEAFKPHEIDTFLLQR